MRNGPNYDQRVYIRYEHDPATHCWYPVLHMDAEKLHHGAEVGIYELRGLARVEKKEQIVPIVKE